MMSNPMNTSTFMSFVLLLTLLQIGILIHMARRTIRQNTHRLRWYLHMRHAQPDAALWLRLREKDMQADVCDHCRETLLSIVG